MVQYLVGDKLPIPVGVDDGASSPVRDAVLPGAQAGRDNQHRVTTLKFPAGARTYDDGRRVHTAANMFVDGIRRFARGRLLPPAADGKLGFVGHEYDARFEAFARERGRTVPQIALQFLAGATGVQTILAGMSTQRHLDENVKVLSLPPLSAAELTQLRDLALR